MAGRRFQVVVSGENVRHEKERRGPDQLLGEDAQDAVFGRLPEIDHHAVVGLGNPHGQRAGQETITRVLADRLQ